MAIQIGDILGDYQVTGVLGRGGMGKVYRVRSLITDREEAMKIVLPDLDEDPGLADRFLREIKVHASLQHPNIAALHTALRIGDRLVMILELVEGASLEDALRCGPLDLSTGIQFTTQILAALSFAHERGVIHRDIKPANILIAEGNVAKLTDFGIARATAGPRLTGTGLAVGTLAYMAPEQILSGHADARSDIYSLGLMSYEMVTGCRPIQGDTEHALMNAQLTTVPPDPAAVNPRVPPAISAAIMRSLAKEPSHRFQSAGEFLAALQQDPGKASGPVPVTPSATVAVTPELVDLEVRLSRAMGPIARRLVADAVRRYGTFAEIRQALAAQIEDPKERQAFLRTDPRGAVTVTMVSPTPTPAPAPLSFDPATLDRLAHALAPYIGPIAKVVVTNAARKAGSTEDLQNALAAEVPVADRQRFLAAFRGVK
jgi:serine/threonine-protein kinase